MVRLVDHLRQRHFVLFDAQMMNPHLARFGAYILDDQDYKNQLGVALAQNCSFV
jgi:leucyl/phenylalanyl-tRNA--protein transferase